MNKYFFNPIFDYIKSVANPGNNGAEAKLFIALTTFLLYVLPASILNFIMGKVPSEFIFYTMVGLIVSCLGMDAIGRMKSNSIKGDVASSIVTESPSKEVMAGAKDMLKNQEGA